MIPARPQDDSRETLLIRAKSEGRERKTQEEDEDDEEPRDAPEKPEARAESGGREGRTISERVQNDPRTSL